MQLTVVRHTQVDVPKGICYGVTDVPLAKSEDHDLSNLSDQFENKEFDLILSSPLSRCRILAEKLAAGRPITIDERLSELDFGDWEMKPWTEIYESEAGKRWFADYIHTACLNGRSYMDMVHDVKSFLDDLKQRHYQQVLIVTHAGVLRILMALLENKTPEETFDTALQYGEIRQFRLSVTR
jgi:alpha-ribazole phosphatase